MKSYSETTELDQYSQRNTLQKTVAALNQELSMLSYAISHDLEQPLRHIMAYSKLLSRKMSEQEDPEIQDFAAFIQSAGEILDARIHAILEYSRLSQHPVKKGPLSSRKKIQEILQAYREEHTHVEFVLEPLPELTTDAFLFSLIFQELVKNALHFSSQEDRPLIRISSSKHEHDIVISVFDNGVGMGENKLERMIRLFQQGVSDLPKDPNSVGKGLALVQRAVNMLEARFSHSLDSEGNTGFHVAFPKGS